MTVLIEWILLLGLPLTLAFIRAPLWAWVPVMAAYLVGLSAWGTFSFVTLGIFWLLFLIPSLLLAIPGLRREWLSNKIYGKLQSAMPKMSQTEQEALDAGDVWWEQDLFCGRPDWKKWLNEPKPTLSAEEQAFLDEQTETLCDMIDDWGILQETREIPSAVMDYIKKEAFWALELPKEYGGHGFSALAHSTIVHKIATKSISVAVTVMVPNSLGPGELLHAYGTEQQKQYYLPRLASGEDIPCFALTGPEAGSDAAAMPDKGFVCKGEHEGKEVIGIRLSWDKRYITLAPIATVLGLAFKLYDPDQLLGDKEDIGVTVCLIPTSHPGVEVGARHYPLGMAFMNGPTRGHDVFIPLDWVIGGTEMVGQGWRMLMECLSSGRAISLPSLGTAGAKLSFRTTGAYASIRRQFNTPIAKFEGVQEALARIGGLTYLLESSRQVTANAVSDGLKPSVASAIAKYHMTEMNRIVMQDAMDVHAGRGVQLGPRNYLASGYISIPIAITVEGANILTRNLIIFGQGAIRCHPYVYKEMRAILDEDKARGQREFDKQLFGHMGYKVSNYVRTFLIGLTGARLLRAPVKGAHAKYYRQLTRVSSALALTSDMAMLILGGALKRKEHLSARLGDVLSYLYLASCALKYYEDQGCESDDLPLLVWSVKHCLHQSELAFDDFFTNFPVPWLARALQWIIFPWGHAFRSPTDKLSKAVVDNMVKPSAFRDRLTENIFIGQDPRSAVWRIEDAFSKMLAAEPAEEKLREAIKQGTITRDSDFETKISMARAAGVLSDSEIKLLEIFETARLDVIAVDEFTPEYLRGLAGSQAVSSEEKSQD